MTIRMRLECRRRQLLIEELVGIVLTALQFGNDHRALGFAVVGMIEAARHALRFDEQHSIERIASGGLEIRRLIDPGVAVPSSTELLDDALDLIARNVRRAFEVHMLAPVRDTGEAGALVLRPDLVPTPY